MQPLASGDVERISRDLGLAVEQVQRTLELLGQGYAVPFIAHYRQELTGGLDEDQIRRIRRAADKARALAKTKATVLKSLEARGVLDDELRRRILAADDPHYVQDLYLPFRTRRDARIERLEAAGIGQLADAVWEDAEHVRDLTAAAQQYVNPDAGLETPEAVLEGVGQLIAQRVTRNAEARATLRRYLWERGELRTEVATQRPGLARAYGEYKNFTVPLNEAPPYHVFQINRGERKRALRVRIVIDPADAVCTIWPVLGLPAEHSHAERLNQWLARAIEQLLPTLEKEVRHDLTDRAEEHALRLIGRHLRSVLLRRGVQGERILAIDPGYRTGCKCVALDETGNPIDFLLVYPHEPLNQRDEAKAKLIDFIKQHQLTLAAIGDGTGSAETQQLIAEIIADGAPGLRYTVVSEAGADTYAEGPVGREEFPDKEPQFRSAVSIGRRVIDPLGELVKIVPRELCTGLDPNDFKLWKVADYLREIVQSCVSEVGVNVNQASRWLLRYVPGLNDAVARQIVRWRVRHGAFRSRRQLLLVDAVDERRFIECSGFLRVPDGESVLDATPIHPEQYDAAARLLELAGVSHDDVRNGRASTKIDDLLSRVRLEHLADELHTSPAVLRRVIYHLKHPDEDPRASQPGPVLYTAPPTLEMLTPGMELEGVVKNVVDFGAFVDVGVRVAGLVHVSRLTTEYIEDPREIVFPGQPVHVWVVEVDLDRSRLSLSMVPWDELQRRQGTRTQQPRRPRRAAGTGRAQPARAARRGAAQQPEPEPAGAGAAEHAASGQPSRAERFRARQQKAAAARQKRERKAQSRPVELTEEALSGKEPLRGFDELKALWEKLHSSK